MDTIRGDHDIRRYPGSRRYPHFSRESLAQSLPITYVHVPELGGRRKPLPDSPNTGWRNEQFRAYADYMATPEFAAALDMLLDSDVRTAIMCAEAVPWRCHRLLISDALVARGVEVRHILGPAPAQPHVLTAGAPSHLGAWPSSEMLALQPRRQVSSGGH